MTISGAVVTIMATAAPLHLSSAQAPRGAPTVQARVVRSYPHDPTAFTQGLFIRHGALFESTGQVGRSTIRKVDLQTGKVLRQARLPSPYFGEGSTDWKHEIVSITWHGGRAFRWRLSDFEQTGTARYSGEGWGLTQDGDSLIMSDGTPYLRFLDPETFVERRRVRVMDDTQPIADLNELEYVRGEILANVWHQDRIARIDPSTGRVKGWIDCSDIVARVGSADPEAVLNGIAYDAPRDRLYITGKNWPALFEIALPR
jgi:glutaminyl-peptide cyclotransferase